MNYTEFKIQLISLSEETAEILSAFLTQEGFDSFQFHDDGFLSAFIETNLVNNDLIKVLKSEPFDKWISNFYIQDLEDKNWNQIWESSYEQVVVTPNCIVRAPFHKKNKNVEYDIEIMPKMSFGTAHHPTTSLMLKFLLEFSDLKGKDFLDMGCGTGVLAILAALKNASNIYAIDNDKWAYENVKENIVVNNTSHIKTFMGDASLLKNISFDLIFANINKNILLNDLETYNNCLNKNGMIFLSGFYFDDLEDIKQKAKELKLTFVSYKEEKNWVAAQFIKN